MRKKKKVFINIEIKRSKVEMMMRNLREIKRVVADMLRCMHKPVLLKGS